MALIWLLKGAKRKQLVGLLTSPHPKVCLRANHDASFIVANGKDITCKVWREFFPAERGGCEFQKRRAADQAQCKVDLRCPTQGLALSGWGAQFSAGSRGR